MLEFEFKARVGDFELHAAGRQSVPRMGLFGPAGCGKSTLLNCLAGLVQPYEGFISLNGRRLFDAAAGRRTRPHRRGIGYVFQTGRLFPHMNVRANLEYGRGRSPAPPLDELIDVLNLSGLLDRSPATLSGGEGQRVALARSLAAGPRLLLLDEPLASNDVATKLRILPYLQRAYDTWSIPFIYVSHSVSEVLFLTERSWQMSRGRIDRLVHPRELLVRTSGAAEPALNILTGIIEQIPAGTGYAVASCRGLTLKVPSHGLLCGDRVALALPARDLMLSTTFPRGLSARNILPARISDLTMGDGVCWVVAEVGDNQLVVELTPDAGSELDLRPGREVFLVTKTHSITAVPSNGKARL